VLDGLFTPRLSCTGTGLIRSNSGAVRVLTTVVGWRVNKRMKIPSMTQGLFCEISVWSFRGLYSLMGIYGFLPWASIFIQSLSPVFGNFVFVGGTVKQLGVQSGKFDSWKGASDSYGIRP